MRLLNVRDLSFTVFFETDVPPYIVASHRWTSNEGHLQDFTKSIGEGSLGYQKVKGFCRFIERNIEEVEWLWIDTVCIDQSSSAEISEAINSMFKYYQRAFLCCAYLHDVSSWDIGQGGLKGFERSVWFTRGWTLQELVAPRKLLFITSDWEFFGCKDDPHIASSISRITGIPEPVLEDSDALGDVPVEERVQWLQHRRTTREEDMAYCILGICNVYMSLIYGEGDYAWDRLEQEVIKRHRRKVTLTRPQSLSGVRLSPVLSGPSKPKIDHIPLLPLRGFEHARSNSAPDTKSKEAQATNLPLIPSPRFASGDPIWFYYSDRNELLSESAGTIVLARYGQNDWSYQVETTSGTQVWVMEQQVAQRKKRHST